MAFGKAMPSEAWLLLLQAVHTGTPGIRAALAETGSAEALVTAAARDLLAFGVTASVTNRLKEPDQRLLDGWSKWLGAPEHSLVCITDPDYPALLRQIADPPIALWVAGTHRELLNAPQLGMVGSRNATAGGTRNAREFARYLGAQGLTITSGLAVGIDGASHAGALATPSATAAVLGSGIDVIYPRQHEALAKRIEAQGLMVSEYPPGTAPQRFQFPARNRLIAGLTTGVVVVEASRNSGSLITAKLAAEYGREVFAIPGSIHNPLARGCHALIRQGAKLVEDAPSILVELAPLLQIEAPNSAAPEPAILDETVDREYDVLIKALGFDPMGIDALVQKTGLTTAEVSSMLLLLELRGRVEAMPGGRYVRID